MVWLHLHTAIQIHRLAEASAYRVEALFDEARSIHIFLQLNYSEKGVSKLAELLKHYQAALVDDEVLESFKASFCSTIGAHIVVCIKSLPAGLHMP